MNIVEAFEHIRIHGGFAFVPNAKQHRYVCLSLPGVSQLASATKLRLRGYSKEVTLQNSMNMAEGYVYVLLNVDNNALYSTGGHFGAASIMRNDWEVVKSLDPEEPE